MGCLEGLCLEVRYADRAGDALVDGGFGRFPGLTDGDFEGCDGLAVFHPPALKHVGRPHFSERRAVTHGISLFLGINVFQSAKKVYEK